MKELVTLIKSHETWLMERILGYAIQHGYAQYTSTLKEPWRLSICGISEPLIAALEEGIYDLELSPGLDFRRDPVAAFGILEAQRHRARGISLGMFVGLFKYYRQSYVDLVDHANLEPKYAAQCRHFIERFFDRVEIGLVTEWAGVDEQDRLVELQTKNMYLTNEKNKYLTLFESLATPVMLLDRYHRIENVNHAAAQVFKITSNRYYDVPELVEAEPSAESFIGRKAKAVLPWIWDEVIDFEKSKDPYFEQEKAIETAHGLRHYQVKLSRMLDISDKYSGILIILNDQTARKLAEERLKSALKAAEAANKAKSEFLANMSHELRTPLNAIMGFSQLMARDINISPEHQANLGIINRSSEHLLGLINQVLDLAKVESGKMTLNKQPFDLYSLLDDLISSFQMQAQEKGLQLRFERAPAIPQFVRTDGVKLRQVLINILNNAIKFTDRGGIAISISLVPSKMATSSPQPNSDDRFLLTFEIADTGQGIDDSELDALFEAFVQTKSGRDTQEGTGLGLAISQRFVHLLGGELTVKSQVGRGTTFSFTIPVHQVTHHGLVPESSQHQVVGLEAGQPTYRILVVDDKRYNRLLLVKLLSPLGFEVREAVDGQEAIDIWEHWDPHLIWMDMRMPRMNGYEATRHIKASTKGQATAVIAMTASVFEEDKNIILSAGCDDVIHKPLRQGDIFDTIAKHLGARYIVDEVPTAPSYMTKKLSAPLTNELSSLSPEWLSAFQEAVEALDVQSAQELVHQIDTEDPALVTTLDDLLRDFRFDVLHKALEKTER